ncbi:penicillin-binding protein 1C [Acidovorax temperans]|uniref:penicillin-binding protein 1C n=1 Tax=Acidovorax temperans TaxID=80878 RepID=UPI001A93D209|nr:penicillin-binding protein 1C [Acidovorax temperans]MBO0941829.1 penicillin-binding protein 1C [Acidovorax temperans]
MAAHALPSYEEVRADFRPSDTLILSREGEVVQRLRTDATVRRGQWVPLADVSPALRMALVLSEDKRFYEHSGVDWRAASAAAWGNLWNQRTRGASTITMQLAGLLDGDWRQGPGGRTVVQKLGQTVAAQVLDRRWRKDQILEAYLNLVPFRSEMVGIDALSRTLFGKAAHGLDDREAAVAAALVRAPNARPALVAQRACGVLRDMQQRPGVNGARVDCDALDLFTTAALQRRAFDASEGVAPHFARYLLRQRFKDGAAVPERVTSTLRAPLQRFAMQSLQQHLRELRGRNVEDGAVLVLDNATGQVLAWVGSSGQLSQASEVDAVLALRQPGSTLKPFLYGQAIAERRLTAASLVEDSPAQITTASGLYIPQNYDRQFKGWVSVRTALAASLNVPAVRTLVMVTPDAFHRQLGALGLPLRENGDYFGYSLALGSAEVPLLHLTNAFRSLANGGRFSPLVVLPTRARPAFTPVLDARAAFIVGDILSDGNARARTFGTDSVLATRFWSAVKTGTSKDMRDNWAVGWSERYTVGVWVGNASGAAMHDVSGTSGAAPVWATVMGFLHAREPSRPPRPPQGLVQWPVRFGPAGGDGDSATASLPLEAARTEWFVPGTQQSVFAINNVAGGALSVSAGGQKRSKPAEPQADLGPARILMPVHGTVIALDPDIPPQSQRLRLQAADRATPRLAWRMDGKPLGRGAVLEWLPWPGRHTLELVDAQGLVLDTVRFEVRGAGVAPGAVPGTASKPR